MSKRDATWSATLLVAILIIWGLSLVVIGREQDQTDYYREKYIQCSQERTE